MEKILLKKEDFNIDPNAETVNADTESLFNKVYYAWYTANQNLLEGMDGLDLYTTSMVTNGKDLALLNG